jgi:transposase
VPGLGERVHREQDAEAFGLQPKKRSLAAAERDEFLRAAWRTLVAGEVHAERLVFVDEMGANVSLCPLYAWSRRGERAFWSAPRNWGKNITLLASITAEGIGPCLAVEGATTREVFEAYLERALAPSLRPGQVIVMDNLSAHKGGRVREIVEDAGCELAYLPPYSPDFNPIEEAFSKVKGLMRQAEARTREALIEAMGRALDAVSARDARGFFEHRGYRTVGQPL